MSKNIKFLAVAAIGMAIFVLPAMAPAAELHVEGATGKALPEVAPVAPSPPKVSPRLRALQRQ